MSGSALQDVKIIDLTHHIAGPYCTKLLADFGADVVKVERPDGGDSARRLGPFPGDLPHPEKSGLFLYLNTNKRAITLNLKDPQGRAMLLALLGDADILVESFSPRVMPSLGLSYQALTGINPDLIVTSISSFGQSGRYRDYRATELVLDALCGMAYITGEYHREPVKHGYNQAQYLGGLAGASGTVAALLARWRSGQGQHVDVSILECVCSTLFTTVLDYTYAGMVGRRQPRQGSSLRYPAQTKEGYVLPTPGVMGDWETYAEMVGVPELRHPKFATPAGRQVHSDEVDALLKAKWHERTAEEWFHHAQQWRFPFAPVQTMADISESPQLRDRGYFVEFPHQVVGTLRYPGAPFKMSESPRRQVRPAPLLGEHNAEVFSGLGYSGRELLDLRAEGSI
jgi:crotonobetainyl-CoA:carnitine CoA-transferase CaiB-like acyl-CoA transferase